MNEMLYGNTGKKDEGININMEQSLYQKLQSPTFVPKLKALLNIGLQDGDKSFVYIGEVVEKTGRYTVYGYNAKLESDNRGGDYGHYIALPLDSKCATVDFSNVKFLTEEGFVEYVNMDVLNDEKRFSPASQTFDIDINVKKRLVNNLLETFMRVRKRKNVSFEFDRSTVEDFSQKSIGILLDIMKYLPFRMRKNISFISHVSTNMKQLPELINFAAYASASEFKPHDCINVSASSEFTDGLFYSFVEKVFEMSDSEREEYFEKIHNEIELPANQMNIEVKSDLYLLDVTSKVLWANGNATEAMASIFSSVEDVIRIYPKYRELAKNRLIADHDEMLSYASSQINSATDTDNLKALYLNMKSLSEKCEIDFQQDFLPLFVKRASDFQKSAIDDLSYTAVADAIVDISPSVLDKELASSIILHFLGQKLSLKDIYDLYLVFKSKNYIDSFDLDAISKESINNFIITATQQCFDDKQKLAELERIYGEFLTLCQGMDISLVGEVYGILKNKFTSGANADAIRKGNEIIYNIEQRINRNESLWDLKGYIRELSEIDVNADDTMKRKSCDIYRRIRVKLYAILEGEIAVNHDEFLSFIIDMKPYIDNINRKGISDTELRSGPTMEMLPFDGLYRFSTFFFDLIDNLKSAKDVADVLYTYDLVDASITPLDECIKQLYSKYAPDFLADWFYKKGKNPKSGEFDKCKKVIRKIYDGYRISDSTKVAFDPSLDILSQKPKKKKSKGALIMIIAIVGIVIGLGVGGYFAYQSIWGNEKTDVTSDGSRTISPQTVEYIENILKSFSSNDDESVSSDAFIVLGKVSPVQGEEKAYDLQITDALGNDIKNKTMTAIYSRATEPRKSVLEKNINPSQEYIIILSNDAVPSDAGNSKWFMCYLFELPDKFENYDFFSKYNAEGYNEEDKEFSTNLLQYVAYKKNYLKLGTETSISSTGDNTDVQIQSDTQENTSSSDSSQGSDGGES